MSPHCDNCGNFVSTNYVRVFADNDGTLRSCYECGKKNSNHQEGGLK